MDLSQFIEQGKAFGLTGKELVDFARDEREKFEHHLELEQRRQREDRQIEREREKEKREHEKEMKELELKIAQERVRGNDSRSTPNPSASAKKMKLPVFNEKTDDLDSYLCRFERYAESVKWDRADWAIPLSTLLTGKALEVYSRMPAHEAGDYDALKAALLYRFELTEDGFKQKFRSSRIDNGETYSQFGDRLKRYLRRWIELAEIDQTFEGLAEFMVVEQMYTTCNKEMKTVP